MKKFVLTVLLIGWSGMVSAATTSGATYTRPTGLTSRLDHTHTYVDTDTVDGTGAGDFTWPLVVGAEAKVYQFGQESKLLDYVSVGGGYDVRNNSPVAEVRVNLDLTKSFKFLRGGKQ